MPYLLSIDQGTTSTRAVIFDAQAHAVATAWQDIAASYPNNGWVEQDPLEIWQKTKAVCIEALQQANLQASDIFCIGITNQRETTVVWDRKTGQPIYPAIVWQDRRTAEACAALVEKSLDSLIALKTGLVIDPYFCASKIAWLLDNVTSAREQALRGQLAFGTIDSYLLWQLTGGKVHATDATNASRTMLFNINTGQWDDELLQLFDIPRDLLPEVYDSAADFGVTDTDLFGGEIAIGAMIGDQQAALVGQFCFDQGASKCTFGTGCFMMMNTGKKPVASSNRLLTTIAYQLQGETTYALEGSIFIAGAAVQWLRDKVHLINDAAETEQLAASIADTGGVYMVPAFTGLGAPYWDPQARAAILGLTRDSGVEQIVRAALEAICYQSSDLLQAMEQDSKRVVTTLKVDGGMVANNWLMQFLADILALPIARPSYHETTAKGAALLAGLQAGLYPDLSSLSSLVDIDRSFAPEMAEAKRDELYQGWQQALARVSNRGG